MRPTGPQISHLVRKAYCVPCVANSAGPNRTMRSHRVLQRRKICSPRGTHYCHRLLIPSYTTALHHSARGYIHKTLQCRTIPDSLPRVTSTRLLLKLTVAHHPKSFLFDACCQGTSQKRFPVCALKPESVKHLLPQVRCKGVATDRLLVRFSSKVQEITSSIELGIQVSVAYVKLRAERFELPTF